MCIFGVISNNSQKIQCIHYSQQNNIYTNRYFFFCVFEIPHTQNN